MVRRQRHEEASNTSPDAIGDAQGIADRLERLTMDDVERVLERAIALQLDRESGLQSERTMDRKALERIADELDLDRSVVEQALVEQMLDVAEDDQSWLDRLVGPKSIKEHGIAPLDAADTQKVVDLWMERHEGMRKTLEVRGVADWEKDLSIGAAARRAMRMSDGSGRLREVPNVTTRVQPIGDDRSVVVVEADASTTRQAGVVGVAVTAFLWLMGFAAAIQSAIVGDGADLRLAAAMVIFSGILGGSFLLAARSWMNKTRKAVKTAIRAVTNPASVRDKSFMGLVSELVAEVTGLAGDLREEIRLRRQPDE